MTQPLWSSDQHEASPLFVQPQIGELSASWIAPLGIWLMLYNAGNPRGINGRVSSSPWGPWSDPIVVFDPGAPGLGYGHFMHVKDAADGLADVGREGEWGGEYGPYIIDRFTRDGGVDDHGNHLSQLCFVMSTWNPYNTVLITVRLQRDRAG